MILTILSLFLGIIGDLVTNFIFVVSVIEQLELQTDMHILKYG